jgi:hypothetical protein
MGRSAATGEEKAMTDRGKTLSTSRRDFLRLSLFGAAGAGVLAATGGLEEADAAEREEGAAGYRESAHVKTYYRLARF